jgi:glyoxylase-like metal-dependent hydrolase (beta-lactamase superfamily II)
MLIHTFILGAYETNCYCLRDNESAKDCIIIDTGFDADDFVNSLEETKMNPLALILTHGHIDHIAGVNAMREKFPEMKLYIHKLDANMLDEPKSNLSIMSGLSYVTDPAEVILEDNQTIELAGIKLEVLHTPGHTPGGISLYSKEQGVVFVGDALFSGSVGRTDFPGGSMNQLIDGIKEKLLTLPEETKVYPGHGPDTTIGREKNYNQYLL